MGEDPAKLLKARLRNDLNAALRARRSSDVRTIRTLTAAIDNAEAVHPGEEDAKYVVRRFGDENVEVPRRNLSSLELEGIITREHDERLVVAEQLERAGQERAASKLREECHVVRSYLS